MNSRLFIIAALTLGLFGLVVWRSVGASPPPTNARGLLVKFRGDPIVKLVPSTGGDTQRTLRNLRAHETLVEYVEENVTYAAAVTPDDPLFPSQWALPKMNAPAAWDVSTGSPSVLIAVLDSGVDVDHPDLASIIAANPGEIAGNGLDDDRNGLVDDVQGWDFVTNLADPSPKFDGTETAAGTHHGSVVAGAAGAVGNNGTGIAGVVWNARILPIRVLDGKGTGETLTVSRGIDYAVSRGAKVVNLSFVGPQSSQTLDDAIARARAAGVVVVAAAGNEGIDLAASPRYPACTTGVIGVAALTEGDVRASFSNYGDPCVDIAAPGENITSTVYEDVRRGYTDVYQSGWFGTSVASPLVAGVFALVASAHPDLTRLQLEEAVLENSAALTGTEGLGEGLVDAARAVGLTTPPPAARDVVTLPGPGGSPQVRIFTRTGKLEGQFFAYEKETRAGGSIAVGDLHADGTEEIVFAPGKEQPPEVRILNLRGELQERWFAYPQSFRGGVNVAVGDVDGDGRDDVVTGPGPGGGPQIRVFNANGKVLGQFFAYSKSLRMGVNVATGDVDGDGKEEIIVGPGPGGGPQVRIFSGKGTVVGQFFAFARDDRSGLNVSAGDLDGDGREEIVVARLSERPTVRTFDGKGRQKKEFLAYESSFLGGVTVSVSDLDADGLAEIIVGTVRGAPHVRILDRTGKLKSQFFAYSKTFRGGVRTASIRE